MFHTFKTDPALVPNAKPGKLRWFANLLNRPMAKNEAGEVFDFTGPQGNSGTVSVGTVTTVASNQPADVDNSGTPENAVLDFKIPQGRAATVGVGTVSTGNPGTDVLFTNVGTSEDAVFNVRIPRGDKGWSPLLAVVSDGNRRVLRVQDWTGGDGVKPAAGQYLGATGFVAAIADAVDIRGVKGDTGAAGVVQSVNGQSVPAVVLTAADVGAISAAEKGAANGVATLGPDQKIPAAQLPSFVDDVIERDDLGQFPATGESGKIYVALDTGRTYRWSGSIYIEISAAPVTQVNGKVGNVTLTTSDIGEGTNLYFTAQRVRDTVLTGLSLATGAVIAAGDSVLSALGKLQKQISDHINAIDPHPQYTSTDEATTIAQAAVDAHAGAVDPHSQYLTQTEGDARYQAAGASNIKTFNSTVNLVAATALTVNHNLALATKDTFVIRTALSNGQDIQLKVISVNQNSLTIESAAAFTGVIVTVMGF